MAEPIAQGPGVGLAEAGDRLGPEPDEVAAEPSSVARRPRFLIASPRQPASRESRRARVSLSRARAVSARAAFRDASASVRAADSFARASDSLAPAFSAATRRSSATPSASRTLAYDQATVASNATSSNCTAAIIAASAGRRRAHFQARSHGIAGRARIGSPSRNRRRSSASSAASAYRRSGSSPGTSGRSSRRRAASPAAAATAATGSAELDLLERLQDRRRPERRAAGRATRRGSRRARRRRPPARPRRRARRPARGPCSTACRGSSRSASRPSRRPRALTRPKSVTLGVPSSPSRTLAGLRSRWTSPMPVRLGHGPGDPLDQGRGRRAAGRGVPSSVLSRLPPSTVFQLEERAGRRPSPMWWICTTLGCRSRATASASARNRTDGVGPAWSPARIIFRAQGRFSGPGGPGRRRPSRPGRARRGSRSQRPPAAAGSRPGPARARDRRPDIGGERRPRGRGAPSPPIVASAAGRGPSSATGPARVASWPVRRSAPSMGSLVRHGTGRDGRRLSHRRTDRARCRWTPLHALSRPTRRGARSRRRPTSWRGRAASGRSGG